MVLEDGMAWDKTTPLQVAVMAKTVVEGNPPVWEQEWHRNHLDKFVLSTELLERSNIITDEAAWWEQYEAETAPRHTFVLRARMADPRFTEGVQIGNVYGTTAFDAWWPDSGAPAVNRSRRSPRRPRVGRERIQPPYAPA